MYRCARMRERERERERVSERGVGGGEEREKIKGGERDGDRARSREGETHVRATTMYFGAALHTPRGGQCPSLLRPKEGAGGYGGSGRGAWRSGKGDRGQALSGKK